MQALIALALLGLSSLPAFAYAPNPVAPTPLSQESTTVVEVYTEVIAWINDDGMGTFEPYSLFEFVGLGGYLAEDGVFICEPVLRRLYSKESRIYELVEYAVVYDEFISDRPEENIVIIFSSDFSIAPMTYDTLATGLLRECGLDSLQSE